MIEEPAGIYMELMEYRTSARGHQITVENKKAMKCYLEELIKGATMKQEANGMLASSEMHTDTMYHLVSLPSRAVLPRHFEEEVRTTSKKHALIEILCVRTELQLRLACVCRD